MQLAKGVRVVGKERDSLTTEVVRRYEAGTSIRAIAAEVNRSYGFVHRLLMESATDLRPRGGANNGRSAE